MSTSTGIILSGIGLLLTCVNFDPQDCQNNKEGVHVQPTLRRRYVRWEYQRPFDTRGVRGG